MTFGELWTTSTDTFQKEPNVTNERFVFFGRKQRDNESMEKFFGALSDLTRGCTSGDPEASIVRDVFLFNSKNEQDKETTLHGNNEPGEALTFAMHRGRVEITYKRVEESDNLENRKLTAGQIILAQLRQTQGEGFLSANQLMVLIIKSLMNVTTVETC